MVNFRDSHPIRSDRDTVNKTRAVSNKSANNGDLPGTAGRKDTEVHYPTIAQTKLEIVSKFVMGLVEQNSITIWTMTHG